MACCLNITNITIVMSYKSLEIFIRMEIMNIHSIHGKAWRKIHQKIAQ